MQVEVVENDEEMSRKAANLIQERIKETPNLVLGLATGSTPIGTYKELIRYHEKGSVFFCKATAFNLDEYCGLDGDHDQSYARFMELNFFRSIDIDLRNTFIPNGNAEDKHAECERYDALIREQGGIDLQLLGIGENGHIGFNEPNELLSAGTHQVKLDPATIEANSRFFNDRESVPKSALTMGMGTILKAKEIILLASGVKKADAIRGLLSGKISTNNPASFLQLHPRVTIIIDREIADAI
jgi:glucosamine-6-phosphate deaminase